MEMGCFPLEACNINHWHVDPGQQKVYFLAPQFIVLDAEVAESLQPLPIFRYKRRFGDNHLQCVFMEQVILLWWTFMGERWKEYIYQVWNSVIAGNRMPVREFFAGVVESAVTLTAE